MSLNNGYRQKEIVQLLQLLTLNPTLNRKKTDDLWDKLNKLQALSQIQIDSIQFKGVINRLDESVILRNRGELTLDISGWRISAGPKQDYTFPTDTFIKPFGTLTVDTHGDGEYSFGSNTPIWNDKGDTAQLFDKEDNLVSIMAYGEHARDKAKISYIHYDGAEFRTEGDEYVEITNLADCDILISGWHLKSESNNRAFVFPDNAKIEAYASVRVYTNKSELEYNEYSFNSPTAIWNNLGGECRMLDYLDRDVSFYSY